MTKKVKVRCSCGANSYRQSFSSVWWRDSGSIYPCSRCGDSGYYYVEKNKDAEKES